MPNNANYSVYGYIARMFPFSTGRIFFVKNSADVDYTDATLEFPPDLNGVSRVYSTLALAAAKCISGYKDIVVCPDSLITTAGLTALPSDVILVPTGSEIGVGSPFIIKKTITSSAITTSAQDLSSVAFGGDLYVENVVLKTDSTGLAGATNFRILSNNSKGLVAILEETVANLGANKTIDLVTASIVKQKTFLESGKKLQFLGTASAGTGAGTVDVYVYLRRAAYNSFIISV